jgi:hypothetical protein
MTLLQIVDCGQQDASFASINLILPDSRDPEYRLKRISDEAGKKLAWCAIEVRETDTSARPIMRVFLHDPSKVPNPKLSLKKNPVWQTDLSFENLEPSKLIIEEIAIQFGDKRCPTTFGKWNEASQIKSVCASLPIEGITEYLKQHFTEEFTQRPQLTIEANNEKGILHLKSRLSGVFGADGLVGDIKEKLESERSKLLDYNSVKDFLVPALHSMINDIRGQLFLESPTSEDMKKLQKSIDDLDSIPKDENWGNRKEKIGSLEDLVKHQTHSNERKIFLKQLKRLKELDKLYADIKSKKLDADIESLRQRHQKFTALSKKLDEATIVTARISYQLFECTDTERKKEPIKAYIVNFSDGNKPGDSKTKEASQ